MKKILFKIIALALILALCVPYLVSCKDKPGEIGKYFNGYWGDSEFNPYPYDDLGVFITLPDYDKELFLNKKNKISDYDFVKSVLLEAKDVLLGIESFDNDTLFATLTPLTEKLSIKTGTLMWCLRIAVSGLSATPGGATEIMEVIGKTETLNRIDVALDKL